MTYSISARILYNKQDKEILSLKKKYIFNHVLDIQKKVVNHQEEITQFHAVPLIIGQMVEKIDKNYAIVSSTIGNNYLVRIISTIEKDKLIVIEESFAIQ